MTYEEIVGKAVIKYAKADASAIDGHVAIQFNVTGEGEGAFYIEVNNGAVDVQPYEYYDRNAIVTVASEILISIFDGKTTLEEAYNDGKINVNGDLGAALVLGKIVVKSAEKKAEPKKATAKKATVKKEAAPKATTAEKKATVKKEAAPKATKTTEKKVATKTTK